MPSETLTITSGLPFSKQINISLPEDRDWWTNINQFEILFQIREGKSRDTPLVKDLAEYLTVVMLNANDIRANLIMTGSDTRELLRGGFYDIIISDVGTTDARAYILLGGPVKRLSTITAELEGEL